MRAHMLTHGTTTGIHTPRVQFLSQRSSHLQLGKLLGFVAGVLRINELSEEELAELRALKEVNKERQSQSDVRCLLLQGNGGFDCVRLLTFLKMAGSGRAGPKKGTSSLAVTDTWKTKHVNRAWKTFYM